MFNPVGLSPISHPAAGTSLTLVAVARLSIPPQFTSHGELLYCTVTVTIVVWCTLPLPAVTVTV